MIKELTDKEILIICKRILDYDIDIALKDLHIFHINSVRKFINSVKYHYDLKKMSLEDYKKVDGYRIEFYRERGLLFISAVGYEKDLIYIHESFDRWDYTNELNGLKKDFKRLRKNNENLIEQYDKMKQKQNDESQINLKTNGTKFIYGK